MSRNGSYIGKRVANAETEGGVYDLKEQSIMVEGNNWLVPPVDISYLVVAGGGGAIAATPAMVALRL